MPPVGASTKSRQIQNEESSDLSFYIERAQLTTKKSKNQKHPQAAQGLNV